MKPFVTSAGCLLLAIGLLTPARAADDACGVVLAAMKKLVVTPTHLYISQTAGDRNKNHPKDSESIYTGGAGGAIYVMLNGKWSRSTLTVADLLRQQDENLRQHKPACQYLREETANGEAAGVYTTRSDTEDLKADATVWISKSKGLPLRQEMDMDMGTGGKAHSTVRFEYTNVHAPAGVP